MIGGKVPDASAVAALVRGRLSAMAWFDTAWALSLPLYLPTLALAEVRAVRPDAGPQLAELDAAAAGWVNQLLLAAEVFDGCAGHVVHVARTRDWPVVTSDPEPLLPLDSSLEIENLP